VGSRGFSTRLVPPDDLGQWDALAIGHGCLFDSLRWTSLFEPRLRRIGMYDGGGDLRGGFCVWEERRFGLRVLRNPPFTPHIGPFFECRATNPAARTDETRDVVEAMANFLDHSGAAVISLDLGLGVTDCLPFHWRGFKVVPQYTYRIDLRQDEDRILASMSVDRRNDIRKAQKDGVEVAEVPTTDDLRPLVDETFGRQEKAFPREVMNTIFKGFPPGENSFCFMGRESGQPVAGIFAVHDARTAYYLVGGHGKGAHHGAGALAMWHAILKAKALGLEVLDFEGSIIPPIERYFRGFGGVLTPYLSVHKAWLPLEMGLKLVMRGLF